MEAFCYPAGRHVEPLEGWTVLKCDWSSARQGSTRHPVPVGASRRDRSGCSSPFAASAYLGGTRRHLPWDRQRLLDEGDRPTPEPRSFHDEPRGSPPWRAQYRASNADQRAWQLALRPKVCHLALHAKLRTIVASKLTEDWSPQLISGWLKIEYPNDESLRVSHETIYRSLFIQARGALKQELIQHLRTKRRVRRSRNASVQRALPRQDRRCRLHSRKTCGSRRASDPRPLGGRSAARSGQQPRGHAGGAQLALCHAHKGIRQRHRHRGGCLEPARATAPRGVAALVDMGSRSRDGSTQELHHGHGCTGLLLRSAKSLATRLERKHQRAVAAIPAQEIRSVSVHSIGVGRDRCSAQYPAATNLGISNSGR
jgi:hypothetical protein